MGRILKSGLCVCETIAYDMAVTEMDRERLDRIFRISGENGSFTLPYSSSLWVTRTLGWRRESTPYSLPRSKSESRFFSFGQPLVRFLTWFPPPPA